LRGEKGGAGEADSALACGPAVQALGRVPAEPGGRRKEGLTGGVTRSVRAAEGKRIKRKRAGLGRKKERGEGEEEDGPAEGKGKGKGDPAGGEEMGRWPKIGRKRRKRRRKGKRKIKRVFDAQKLK